MTSARTRRPVHLSLRCSCLSAVAWLLVFAFVCVPALTRVHDHFSSSDQKTGLRFSKTVDRPHEKHTSTRLIVIGAVLADEHPSSGEHVAATGMPAPGNRLLFAPSSPRAPPAR